MRYDKLQKILDLIFLMQAKSQGVSLADIQNEYEVKRRTAERMRDVISRAFGTKLQEIETTSRIKRWTLKENPAAKFVSFSPEELAELENVRKNYEADKLQIKADVIKHMLHKMKILSGKFQAKVDNELEILLEAESFAVRQRPFCKIDKEVLGAIREAIMAFKSIKIAYEKSKGKVKTYKLHPYGVIYGEKHNLVAFDPKDKEKKLFTLSKIKEISLLDEYFDVEDGFDLKEYAENSFAVYQEDPISVVLKFNSFVADEAKNFYFHPSQKIEENDDGSVTVKFKAGGSVAICWHLFRWGKDVQIIKPLSLHKQYAKMLEETLSAVK
jgi:predicted DNA-binding transcriptional regulator YafY